MHWGPAMATCRVGEHDAIIQRIVHVQTYVARRSGSHAAVEVDPGLSFGSFG